MVHLVSNGVNVTRDECVVVNTLAPVFPQQDAGFLQEANKQGGGNPFVAVNKAVVFGDKVKQVRRFFSSTVG